MNVEQRARDLLAAEYESAGHTTRAKCIRDPNGYIEKLDKCNLRAIIAALTPPEGYLLVPVIPRYEMVKALAGTAGCNLAQAALAYRDALAARPEVPNVND